MQAIEFETHLKDGIIQLPPSYQHWQEGQHVKVIVLAAENDTRKGNDINRHAGKITLTQDPLAFQDAMRDEITLRDIPEDLHRHLKQQAKNEINHEERLSAIMEISRRCAALPELDPRSANEIIGYDENGLKNRSG